MTCFCYLRILYFSSCFLINGTSYVLKEVINTKWCVTDVIISYVINYGYLWGLPIFQISENEIQNFGIFHNMTPQTEQKHIRRLKDFLICDANPVLINTTPKMTYLRCAGSQSAPNNLFVCIYLQGPSGSRLHFRHTYM